MEIDVEEFLALTARLAGFVPGAAGEEERGGEGEEGAGEREAAAQRGAGG